MREYPLDVRTEFIKKHSFTVYSYTWEHYISQYNNNSILLNFYLDEKTVKPNGHHTKHLEQTDDDLLNEYCGEERININRKMLIIFNYQLFFFISLRDNFFSQIFHF